MVSSAGWFCRGGMGQGERVSQHFADVVSVPMVTEV